MIFMYESKALTIDNGDIFESLNKTPAHWAPFQKERYLALVLPNTQEGDLLAFDGFGHKISPEALFDALLDGRLIKISNAFTSQFPEQLNG